MAATVTHRLLLFRLHMSWFRSWCVVWSFLFLSNFNAKMLCARAAEEKRRIGRVVNAAVFLGMPYTALAAAFHPDPCESSINIALIAIKQFRDTFFFRRTHSIAVAFHEAPRFALGC